MQSVLPGSTELLAMNEHSLQMGSTHLYVVHADMSCILMHHSASQGIHDITTV